MKFWLPVTAGNVQAMNALNIFHVNIMQIARRFKFMRAKLIDKRYDHAVSSKLRHESVWVNETIDAL